MAASPALADPRPPFAAPIAGAARHGWRAALAAAAAAPRCGARCRTRGHAPCRNPAMANGRCRMHGGKSTGARTEAGRERCRMARTRHGSRSAYWVGQRKLAMRIRRETRRLAALVDLKLMDRAAEAKGIETGLDWDDLPFRPLAHVEARKVLLAALMSSRPAETPPPPPRKRRRTPCTREKQGKPFHHGGAETQRWLDWDRPPPRAVVPPPRASAAGPDGL